MLIKEISDTSSLVTATVFNTNISEVESKITDSSSAVTTTVLNIKVGEFENKILDHAKYISTAEFNELTAEHFAARLKRGNLVTKIDFGNKLTSFNTRITWNETERLEV